MLLARGSVFVVLAVAALGVARADAGLEPHRQVLGVKSGDALADVSRRLGPAKVTDNGGEDAGRAAAACYVGADGTTLVLVTTDDSPGKVEMIELLGRRLRADREEDLGESVFPPGKQPRCAKLARLSRATGTRGGLRLGMSRGQVVKLLGEPMLDHPEELWFIEHDADGYDIQVKLRFEQGKVASLRAGKFVSGRVP